MKMEEKKKKAVALRYDPKKDNAPIVVAKGVGELAQKIIELAKESKVPVLEDEQMVEALIKLEVFEDIPPVLYEAVARILVFIQEVRKKSS